MDKITRYLLEITTYASKEGSSDLLEVSKTEYESDSATMFTIPQSKFYADDVTISFTIKSKAIRLYKKSSMNAGMIELEKEIKIEDSK